MFMWFCDGNKIPKDALPLPQGGAVDYYGTLVEECNKLKLSRTPVYLVYLGRLLTPIQKKSIESLAHKGGLENLLVINFDNVLPLIAPQIQANNIVVAKLDKYIDQFRRGVSESGINEVVEISRMVLLYGCDVLKTHALTKYIAHSGKKDLLERSASGLLYRDFDVVLSTRVMPDIILSDPENILHSTNHRTTMLGLRRQLTEECPAKKHEIEDFFEKYCLDLDTYIAIKKEISNGAIRKTALFKGMIVHSGAIGIPYEELFDSKVVLPEDSLLGVNKPKHPIMRSILDLIFRSINAGRGPYSAFCDIVENNSKSFLDALKFEKTFMVGNDLTWSENAQKLQYKALAETVVSKKANSNFARVFSGCYDINFVRS